MKALRTAFVFLSCVQLLVGFACIGIGAWLADKPNDHYEMANLVTDGEFAAASNHTGQQLLHFAKRKGQLEVAGYCFISSGVASIIAFLLALLTAFRFRIAVLALCAVTLCMLVLNVCSVFLGDAYSLRVQRHTARGWLKLQDLYYVPIFGPSVAKMPEGSVTAAINFVHVTGECCGAVQSHDVAVSPRWRQEAQRLAPNIRYPVTCCPVTQEFREKVKPEGPWEELADNLVRQNCPVDGVGVHTKLCPDVVVDKMQVHQRRAVAMATGIVCSVYNVVLLAVALVFAVQSKD